MPRLGLTKTNRLTIYMLKTNVHELADVVSVQSSHAIEGVGHFYFEQSHTESPTWIRSFFGERLADLQIFTASARGLLVVQIPYGNETIFFAVSFGVGRFLLKDGVIEEGFGLKVVLNSADADSFRSIDKTSLGSVPKHSREQMSRDVTPADFGIDIEQDLVSLVTARSRDLRLGKLITGKDALYLSAPVDAANVVEFLSYCHDRYRSDDYKENFDWIDQISEVRSKRTQGDLNDLLVERINQGNLDKVWMAVPE